MSDNLRQIVEAFARGEAPPRDLQFAWCVYDGPRGATWTIVRADGTVVERKYSPSAPPGAGPIPSRDLGVVPLATVREIAAALVASSFDKIGPPPPPPSPETAENLIELVVAGGRERFEVRWPAPLLAQSPALSALAPVFARVRDLAAQPAPPPPPPPAPPPQQTGPMPSAPQQTGPIGNAPQPTAPMPQGPLPTGPMSPRPPAPEPPAQAEGVRGFVEAWRRREIDGIALMRALVSFEKWMVPVTQAAAGDMLGGEPPRIAFSVDDQGVRRLLIFSSSEAYDALRTRLGPAAPPEQHFLATTGTWVFAAPPGSFDWIVIDPATEWEIAYGSDHLPRLAQTAAAVSTERALAALRTPADPPDPTALPTVREHLGYILAVVKEGEQVRLALAPDPQGRVLAAVFTHDDCFEAFASGVGGGLMMLNLPGRQLFEQLSETQLDGIVFNPAGPPAPVAFAAAFSRLILDSGG